MGTPFDLVVTGAVAARPFPGGASGGQTLQEFVNLGMEASLTARQAGVIGLVSATDEPIPFGSMTKCRFLAINVISGAFVVKLTNPTNTDQIVRVGKKLLIYAPNPGEELTEVTMTGTGEFEYVAAGE